MLCIAIHITVGDIGKDKVSMSIHKETIKYVWLIFIIAQDTTINKDTSLC